MSGELIEIFSDEIRDAILDIGRKLLKIETDNFQVHVEPLFTEGEVFSSLISLRHSEYWIVIYFFPVY